MQIIIGFLLLLALPALYIFIFNRLRTAQTRVRQGWSGIEVQLKRRHDLLPNLVTAVKAAKDHDRAMLERIIEARENAIAALHSGKKEYIAATEADLSGRIHALTVQIEDNPDITATGNIETFQRQLEETEDQIAAARRLYNGNVQVLNARISTFPGNFIAPTHAIRPAEPFEMTAREKATTYDRPAVDFG